jgi:hypothetical protein
MMQVMSAILYPVADNAEAALARPVGRAAREREAGLLAAGPVRFVSEDVGAPFKTREAALDAHAGRIDDDRPGRVQSVARRPQPVAPSFMDGHRWPKPPKPPKTEFRLTVSYWKTTGVDEAMTPDQARIARRQADAATLDAAALRALAARPMRAVRPQQALDIGLFERPLPETPHILIPDE